MLGVHADTFFRRQANERVVASTPNAKGGSYTPFDMEKAGTKTTAVRGNYEMPGPQNQVHSGYMPGMSGFGAVPTNQEPIGVPPVVNSMLPSMGAYADVKSMLPGMGAYADVKSMLPGMGALDTKSLMLLGLAVGGLWYMYKNKAFA
jgi:hypothetical protein